jgi:peptidoglycan/LPS O-acetylase OafA/YrhL
MTSAATNNHEIAYRPDVDGLRAVAVGIVVLFHARLGLFPGGYTGVDVFFVISGFLISSIIWRELQAGKFTIAGFYERRIRRIFPALAVIILVTLVVGAVFFAPPDYATLGRSARATAAFYSNFFFNSQFGYFMPGAETQPLLHTWSLAVEEQFYFVAPFFLILLARMQSRHRIWLFLALFAVSLTFSSVGALGESKGAFYLPHSRAFELMMGMALVIGLAPVWRNDAAREAAAFLGLGMIVAAAVFYSDATPFPGLAAVVPCLGTMLLINTASNKPTMVSRALSAAPLVMTGKISYSLYLWHWPIFVFAEYQYGERLPVAYSLGLIALSVALSFVTYRLVEQPARQHSFLTRRTVIGAGVGAMAALVVMSQGVIETKGWPDRLDPEVAAFAKSAYDAKVPPPCRDKDEDSASAAGCTIGVKDVPPTFMLWGDSHAVALSAEVAAVATAKGVRGDVAVIGGCGPFLVEAIKNELFLQRKKCKMMSERVAEMLKRGQFRHVVIAGRWAFYAEGDAYDNGKSESNRFSTGDVARNRALFHATLRGTVERIVATGRTVTLIGPIPELKGHLPNAMIRALMRKDVRDFSLPYAVFAERNAAVLKTLDELDKIAGVRVVYPHKTLCDATACKTTAEGKPYYYDDDHLGLFGTKAIEGVLTDAIDVSASFNAAQAQ